MSTSARDSSTRTTLDDRIQSADGTQPLQVEPPRLAHALTSRQVQFIALGGAVGAGLFLGSGVAISRAGPALLIAYTVAGTVIFLMARALGELALFMPVAGAFGTHARELIGPRAGFITGGPIGWYGSWSARRRSPASGYSCGSGIRHYRNGSPLLRPSSCCGLSIDGP